MSQFERPLALLAQTADIAQRARIVLLSVDGSHYGKAEGDPVLSATGHGAEPTYLSLIEAELLSFTVGYGVSAHKDDTHKLIYNARTKLTDILT